jgi:hypothetical protein
MKINVLLKFTILFCLLVFFASQPVLAQTKVQAQGMATIHKNLVDIARSKAIDEAQRSAVERVVGVMISSSTEVENYQVKLDSILSESQGFINTYKVIQEEREGDQYRVTIEADVGVDRLKDKMEAFNMIMSRQSRPRLLVLIGHGKKKDDIAESAMVTYFLSKGFKMVDVEAAKGALARINLEAITEDPAAAAKVGHRYGAEVLIVGRSESSTSPFSIGNVEMKFNKVNVSAKAMKVDTAEIIATDSDTKSGPGMEDVLKTMTTEASEKVARTLADRIVDKWSYELTNTVTVKLVASGLKSRRELEKFKSLLSKEVKGVKEVNQRRYHGGRAELDMEVRGNTQGVADDVEAMTLNGKAVKVVEITPNRIEVKIGP